MSTFKHRQPIFSWSSVVLLSTLLLSPMTAATLLHALTRAVPTVLTPFSDGQTAAAPPATATAGVTRRANDEQEALRRAALRAARLRAVRLDADPHPLLARLTGGAIALYVPLRTTERVPDVAAVLLPRPEIQTPATRARLIAPVPPRAPPPA
jgi:hypothetical protein